MTHERTILGGKFLSRKVQMGPKLTWPENTKLQGKRGEKKKNFFVPSSCRPSPIREKSTNLTRIYFSRVRSQRKKEEAIFPCSMCKLSRKEEEKCLLLLSFVCPIADTLDSFLPYFWVCRKYYHANVKGDFIRIKTVSILKILEQKH